MLIYTEKYSVADDIAKILADDGRVKTLSISGKMPSHKVITYNGKETTIVWGHGHLCSLKQAYDYNPAYKMWSSMPMPFIPEKYEIKGIDGEQARLKELKKFFDDADLIVNATDYDREGEVIFYYLYQYFKCKTPYKRAHFSSFSDSEIKRAFSNLKKPEEIKNITDAGRARGIADWVVGSNITALSTLKFSSGKNVLSVGRVQTPTLKILVDREKQLRGFTSSEFYVLTGEFTTATNEKYQGECKTRYEKKSDVPLPLPVNGTIEEIKKTQQKKYCPQLFTQATLGMAANDKYGFTLQETLDASQKLYEAHLTTYPRTDAPVLTEDMYDEANNILSKIATIPAYGKLIQNRKIPKTKYFFDDSKVDSHSAIIPTGTLPSEISKTLTQTEKKVLDLIYRRLIATVCGEAVIEKTIVKTVADKYEFYTNGSEIIQKGWLEALGCPKETILPDLKEKESVQCKAEVVARKTKSPPAFTDKTLVKAMITAGKDLDNAEFKKILEGEGEKGGIGRPATRAGIVEKLVKCGYVERKGKSLRATDKGIFLIDTIPIEDIKSPILTAKWEIRLDKIAKGEDDFDCFVQDIEVLTKTWCDDISNMKGNRYNEDSSTEALGLCPLCGGKVFERKFGYVCCNCNPEKTDACKFRVSKNILAKKISPAMVKKLLKDGKTNVIKGFYSEKKGKKFDARLKVDSDGKVVFDFS